MFNALRRFNAKTMFYIYPIIMSSNYCSLWLLTAICAQRYQSLCYPSSVWKARLGLFRKSKRCVVIIVLLAVGKFYISLSSICLF